jgi:hypothetical protein
MAKQIEHIRIKRHDDGSHTIEHSFKPEPKKNSKASMGVSMDYPEGESYSFGPEEKEQHRMLTHIAGALGFKRVAAKEGAEDKQMGKGKPANEDED